MKRMVLFTLLFAIVGAAPAKAEGVNHMGCYDNGILQWKGTTSHGNRSRAALAMSGSPQTARSGSSAGTKYPGDTVVTAVPATVGVVQAGHST